MILNSSALTSLNTGFKTLYDQTFSQAKPQWDKVAMLVPSTSKDMTYAWLGQTTQFREWVGSRVIQNLSTHSYTVTNKEYENTVSVKRTDIEDDNIGIYNPLMQNLGNDAAMHPDELVFQLLADGFTTPCYDGQYFIDTDHPVPDAAGNMTSVSNFGGGTGAPWFLLDTSKSIKPLIFQKRREYTFISKTNLEDENVFNNREFVFAADARVAVGYGLWQQAFGSKQVLTPESFEAGKVAMSSLKGENGKPLRIRPTLLVCGPSNESAALRIAKAAQNANGSTNIYQGSIEVLVVPYLA